MILDVFLFASCGMCGLAVFVFYYLLDGACFQITNNCWECNVQAPTNITDAATWVNQYCINEAWVNGTVRCFYNLHQVKAVCDDNDLRIMLVSATLFAACVFTVKNDTTGIHSVVDANGNVPHYSCCYVEEQT